MKIKVENPMIKFLNTYKGPNDYVKYNVSLNYKTAEDTRPYNLNFIISFYHERRLIGLPDIPKVTANITTNPYRGKIENPVKDSMFSKYFDDVLKHI